MKHQKARNQPNFNLIRIILLVYMTAVMNYHGVSGLEQYIYIILQFRQFRSPNGYHWAKIKPGL